ncbi:hypothetical protein JF50_19455 [Pseudoalteromonas luteoviolacea]|uniref:Uncharacterized protein n=1 Tax=Pseudoalteromonas luteoviolacea TaxID=43657 RepID=A0A0C1MP94_9GAMM|nr:hypothetical protein JF50_19455 [Pseudoalteromonas luteoviolacea]
MRINQRLESSALKRNRIYASIFNFKKHVVKQVESIYEFRVTGLDLVLLVLMSRKANPVGYIL